jgi:hypothetical protein
MHTPSGPVVSLAEVMLAVQAEANAIREKETKPQHHAIQELTLLVEDFGYDRVSLWLRNIGASLGPQHGTSLGPSR